VAVRCQYKFGSGVKVLKSDRGPVIKAFKAYLACAFVAEVFKDNFPYKRLHYFSACSVFQGNGIGFHIRFPFIRV